MNPLVTRNFLAALLVTIVLAVLRDLRVPSSKVSTGCVFRDFSAAAAAAAAAAGAAAAATDAAFWASATKAF